MLDKYFDLSVRTAEQALRSLFPKTPLQHNLHLSAKYDAKILLKREDLSPVRSYKLRGAFNAISKQRDKDLFVAASAGNHAQGVAFVCAKLQKRGVIFMPVTTPEQKVRKTKHFGEGFIEIRQVGDYFDDCLTEAQRYCADEGGHFLSPFDDWDVIEGQATVTSEILGQCEPDIIILPVGGGGLSAGAKRYIKAIESNAELIFVEPTGGASLKAAIGEKQRVRLKKLNTFVDGAAVAQVGAKNFEVLASTRAGNIYTAPEDRICGTMLEMLDIEGIVLEPAGALALDVLPSIQDRIRGKSVVCVTSGGNFDFERLPEVKERARRYMGLKKYFILTLPQRPGALKDFLNLLGPEDDIARFEYFKKSSRNFGTILLGLETTTQDNFTKLLDRMIEVGFEFQDLTHDDSLANLMI